MHISFRCIHSPDNTLVELCNFQPEKLLEVKESYVIKTFSHMINASWIIRVDYFHRLAITLIVVITVEFSHAISFRDIKTLQCAIPINSHCSNVDDMTLFIIFHDCHQDIFSWKSVILIGIVDGFQGFHWIGSCPLFSQMCNNVWFKFCKQFKELGLLMSNVDLSEFYFFPRNFLPTFYSFLNWLNRCDTWVSFFFIDFSAWKVINNENFPSHVGHSQRERPSDEAIATSDQNFHFIFMYNN